MKKYKVTLYPNVNDYVTEVEAMSVKEAIEIAQDEASLNCYFVATKDDVIEVDE